VDGCISIDAAPKNESGNEAFGSFTHGVLTFMHDLSRQPDLTKKEIVLQADEYFKGKK